MELSKVKNFLYIVQVTIINELVHNLKLHAIKLKPSHYTKDETEIKYHPSNKLRD
jgi:hypothetical protein